VTERIGHVWHVKPGRGPEYLRRHATIWPELATLLRSAGVRSYTIYLYGELVFSHMEVDDYAAMIERLAADPVAARWEEQFADVLEYPDADPETGWPARAVEVWRLDELDGEPGPE
jgi:L-rhamnose mutarotase